MGIRERVDRLSARLREPSVGLPTVFVASFLEATAVPIPIEVALVPLMAKARERLWSIALAALAGALAGAALGYVVGYFLFDVAGRPLLAELGALDAFQRVRDRLEAHGFAVVFTIGVSAVPFQVATVGAGVTQLNLAVFIAATLLARGLRYLGLAALVAVFGPAVEGWIRRNKRTALALTLVAIAAVAAWVILRP